MKIAFAGSNGMLGNAFQILLKNSIKHNSIFKDRTSLDITNKHAVNNFFEKNQFDVFINCAAYTNPDQAESEPEIVNLVNGEAVGYLAKKCKEKNILFITFSTDYVFDGSQKEGYLEFDKTNPINNIGLSKVIGEKLTQEGNSNYYIIRVQWTYGPHGNNFVKTITTLFNEGKKLKIIDNEFGSPTYTLDIANKTLELIENNDNYMPGIYHMTNSGITNWHNFAEYLLSKYTGEEIKLDTQKSEEMVRIAKRPHFSKLISTKFEALRSWEEAIEDFLTDKEFKI